MPPVRFQMQAEAGNVTLWARVVDVHNVTIIYIFKYKELQLKRIRYRVMVARVYHKFQFYCLIHFQRIAGSDRNETLLVQTIMTPIRHELIIKGRKSVNMKMPPH